MNYTDVFFDALYRFQNERHALDSDFEKRKNELEPMHGSQYYEDKMKRLKTDYKTSGDVLKDNYRLQIDGLLTKMRETIERKPLKAPTADQMAILQALRLKENTTTSDYLMAANSCSDSGLALSILQEDARKRGFLLNLMSKCQEASPTAAAEILKRLDEGCADFLSSAETRASRVIRRHNENVGANAGTPKMREIFQTKSACYSELGLTAEQLSLLSSVVDD